MKAMTEAHLAILRRHMVELVDMHFDLSSDETGREHPGDGVRQAMLDEPRHLYVPPQLAAMAYHDTPLPIGFDKTISQPFICALMLDMLDLQPGQRVLEVGTGLGYQSALMARMGGRVASVEIVEEFAEAATARLAELGHQVEVKVGDGSRGWIDHAPYDRILVVAAATEPPPALVEQLAPGGLMVIPLGDGEVQELSIVRRAGDEARIEPGMKVRFTRLESMG